MKPYKCRVEYLESTGTQYIDTGVLPSDDLRTKVVQAYTGTAIAKDSSIFGSKKSDDNSRYWVNYDTYFEIGYGTYLRTSTVTQPGEVNTIDFNYLKGDGSHYFNFNGAEYVKIGTPNTQYSIVLFGRVVSTQTPSLAPQRIYKVQFIRNDVLIGDFIPVLDNNGRPAMYDNVSGQLFYNQGTGEFTYGRKIIPVEYLESNGGQYIDTGIQPTDEYGYKIRNTYTVLGGEQCAIGGMDSGNRFVGIYTGGGQNSISAGWGSYVEVLPPYAWSSYPYIDVTCNYKNDRKITVNNIEMKDISEIQISGTLVNSIYLFSRHYGSATAIQKGKIYNAEITKGQEVIANFIPCIDENNTPFMFDLISCKIYENAGTGQFKVGANIDKSGNKNFLRKKLDMFLATLKKKRPYYCEVEYLENTGVAAARNWINTGIVPDTTTKWEVRLSFNNTSTGKLMGSGYAPPTRFNIGIESSKFRFAFNAWFDANSNITTPDTNPHTWVMDATTKTFTIDEYSVTSSQNFGTSTFPIGLFGRCNSASGVTETSNAVVGKIYYSKIWQNNVLVRDMIPVLDWDYVPCMYDKVSGELFYNKGTGSFTYGREIHYVDYLESTGTQYINTNFKPTTSTDFEIEFSSTKTGVSNWIMGCATWVGVHYKQSNDNKVGVTNNSNAASQQYISYTPNNSKMTLKLAGNTVYANGVSLGTITRYAASQNLALFGYQTNATTTQLQFTGSIYKVKIWDNNVPIYDFKPAIDENGVGFMFDRVSHTIYDNAGTGYFKYPARETEYTANAGTYAYIDLGMKYKTSMSIKGKFTRDEQGENGSVMFLTTSTTAPLIYMPGLSGSTKVDRYVWRKTGYAEQHYYYNFTDYPITEEVYLDAINDKLWLDGNLVLSGMLAAMDGYETPYESYSNMYLFSMAQAYSGNGKIYYCQIDDGTTPIFDLIPAYQDGQAGFYNKIDGTFFANASANADAKLTAGRIIESEWE